MLPLVDNESIDKAIKLIIEKLKEPNILIGVLINTSNIEYFNDSLKNIAKNNYLLPKDNFKRSIKFTNCSRIIFKNNSRNFKGYTLNDCFIFETLTSEIFSDILPIYTNLYLWQNINSVIPDNNKCFGF